MKNTFQRSGRLLAFGCIFSALLFTSCSEETLETDAPIVPDAQDLVIALKENPSELVVIDASETTALKTTHAKRKLKRLMTPLIIPIKATSTRDILHNIIIAYS